MIYANHTVYSRISYRPTLGTRGFITHLVYLFYSYCISTISFDFVFLRCDCVLRILAACSIYILPGGLQIAHSFITIRRMCTSFGRFVYACDMFMGNDVDCDSRCVYIQKNIPMYDQFLY